MLTLLFNQLIMAIVFAGGFFVLIAFLKFFVKLNASYKAMIVGGCVGAVLFILVFLGISFL